MSSKGSHTRPIFITARFRSGSTLLWNLFRNLPGCLAFYEPCNDLLTTHIEIDTKPPPSHQGVTSYWDEYRPILEELRLRYRQEFGLNHLYLENQDTYPDFENYIRFLLKAASGKVPVLQFNRIDFRLPWLRERFPNAFILHLTRNSRDMWFSMIRGLSGESWRDPLENTNYDLLLWSVALSSEFPFLFSPEVKTTYHRHYLLWRLSGLMGTQQADMTLDFDRDLLGTREKTLQLITDLVGADNAEIERLAKLVVMPETGGWRKLIDGRWFTKAEMECDALLEELGLLEDFGKKPLASIRKKHLSAWNHATAAATERVAKASAKLFGMLRRDRLVLGKDHEQYVINSGNVIRHDKKLLEDAAHRLNSVQQNFQEAEESLRLKQQAFEESQKVLANTQTALENKRQELVTINQRYSEVQEQLRAKQQAFEESQKVLASTQTALENKRQELVSINQRYSEKQEQLRVNQQALEESQKVLASTQTALNSKNQELVAINQRYSETQEQLRVNQQAFEENQKVLTGTQTELNSKSQELAALSQCFSETKDLLRVKQQEFEESQKVLANTQTALEIERQELVAINQRYSETQEQLRVKQQAFEESQKVLASTQTALENKSQELVAINQRYSETQEQLRVNQQEFEESQEALSDAQNGLNEKERELILMKETLGEMRLELHKERSELENAQEILTNTRIILAQNEQILRETALRVQPKQFFQKNFIIKKIKKFF